MTMTFDEFIEKYLLGALNERERRITMQRYKDVFGYGENTATLRIISIAEGVNHERIRQIAVRARRKIHHALYMIDRKMSDPHIIIKEVPTADINKDRSLPVRQKYIYELGDFSVRIYNCLANDGLLTLDKLLEQRISDLLRVPNLGRKSIRELIAFLDTHGLKLKFDPLFPNYTFHNDEGRP